MAPKRRLAATTLVLSAAALGACSTADTHHAGDHSAVLHNPSPAMVSLAERSSDRANRAAKSWDTDLRMMHGDASRLIFYTHEPSRLTPTTKPY